MHQIVQLDTADKAPNAPTSSQTVVNIVDDDWTWGPSKKDKKKKKTSEEPAKGSLKETFISRQHDSSWDVGLTAFPPARCNQAPEEDYTEVFLSHARLYVFAEKYDIQPLKTLALKKLHQTLAIYTLYPERVGDITALFRYVYANTAESADGKDSIRQMLAHYIGCEMGTLLKHGEIKEIMLENGEVLDDFLVMFARRVT